MQFGIGDLGFCAGDRAVVDDGHLIGTAIFDVAVDRVVAAVDTCIGEPFIEVVALVK